MNTGIESTLKELSEKSTEYQCSADGSVLLLALCREILGFMGSTRGSVEL